MAILEAFKPREVLEEGKDKEEEAARDKKRREEEKLEEKEREFNVGLIGMMQLVFREALVVRVSIGWSLLSMHCKMFY